MFTVVSCTGEGDQLNEVNILMFVCMCVCVFMYTHLYTYIWVCVLLYVFFTELAYFR